MNHYQTLDARKIHGKRRIAKLDQWVFMYDWSFLGWQPLSASLCQSGEIVLFPVRSYDVEVKLGAVMPSIIGIKSMRKNKHYVLLSNTGLTGRDWQKSIINSKLNKQNE